MNTAPSIVVTFGTLGIHIEVLSVQALGAGAVAWLSVTPNASEIVGHERQQEAVRKAAVKPPPAASGAVVLMASGAWLEAFPSSDVLVASAEGLLADLFAADEPPFESDPRMVAERALSLVLSTECRPIDRVPDTLGDPYALDGSGAHDSCVLVAGALAHLAIGIGSERAIATESPATSTSKPFSW